MSIIDVISYCRARAVDFRLDGDRLKLVGNKDAIDDQMLQLVREHKSALIKLLSSGASYGSDHAFDAINPAERGELQLPSFNQQRLWFLQQLASRDGGAEGAYNGAVALTLKGSLDHCALEAALQALVQRHESLRTSFVEIDGAPWQRVRSDVNVECILVTLGDDENLDALMRVAAAAPFDLANDTLIRATLYVHSPQLHTLLLVTHHITSDAWSQGILINDFSILYNSFSAGKSPDMMALPYQYIDYARWERSRLQGETLASKLKAWRTSLGDAPRLHSLPYDRPRSAEARGPVAHVRRELSENLASALIHAARTCETTLFNVSAALYSILIYRLGGTPDVVFGMPVANRVRAEFETITGYFSNTVVLRNSLPVDCTFDDVVEITKRNMQFVLSNQDVPFDMLVDELKVRRSAHLAPVYQLWFSLHEQRQVTLDLNGVDAQIATVEREHGRYDLKLEVERRNERISMAWEYDSNLFDAAAIEQFADHFEQLVAALCYAPETRIFSVAFKAGDVSAGVSPSNMPSLLPEVWSQTLAHNPDRAALTTDSALWSYAWIAARAQRLGALMMELGVVRGSRIGICAEASIESLTAMLATWQLGAACVPINPHTTPERVAAIVAGSDPVLVLATPNHAVTMALRNLEIVLLDGLREDDWLIDYAAEDDAAVVAEAADCALILSMPDAQVSTALRFVSHDEMAACAATLRDRHALATALGYAWIPAATGSFCDLAMLLSVAGGGTLHLPAVDCRDDVALSTDAFGDREINVVALDPQRLRAFVAHNQVPWSCGHLFVVDAERPPRLAHRFVENARSAGCRIVACVTFDSAGVCCLTRDVQSSDDADAMLLGRPPLGTRAILSQGDVEAPLGANGELVLVEDIGDEDRVSTESARHIRLTGLRAHIDHRGELVYGGRFDSEVVCRGFRVDPRDIEQALLDLPDVSAAAVRFNAGSGDDGRLEAYVVAEDDAQTLQQNLKHSLPQHQLPDSIVVLDRMVFDSAGNIDACALPAVHADRGEMVLTATGRELQRIWSELLVRPVVVPSDNFFEIGGHSLLATRMLNRVRSRLWAELALSAIFDHPVLRDLAEHIDTRRAGSADVLPPIRRIESEAPARLSYGQRQIWLVDRIEEGSSHYNMVAAYRLRGPLDTEALGAALRILVERHDALRTRFFEQDGEIRQACDHAWMLPLTVADYSVHPESVREAMLREHLRNEAGHRFDLDSGVLLRATLIQLGQDAAVLALNIHHIACDGWSIDLLVSELRDAYAMQVRGFGTALARLPIRYRDYAEWQYAIIDNERFTLSADYWRNELLNAPQSHPLILDMQRPAISDHAGAEHTEMLDAEALDGLRSLASKTDTTLFVVLESLFALFIARIGGVDDVVIGTAVSGRTHADVESMVGLFANLVPLRHRIDHAQTLSAYITENHERVGRALGHQHFPFEALVEALNPDRSLGLHSIFQIAFGLKEAEPRQIVLLDVVAERVERDHIESKFDLMLSVIESAQGLRFVWQYATALFEPASIARLAAQFNAMLSSVLLDPACAIGRFDLLTEADHRFIAVYASGGDAGAYRDNLFDRFAEHAKANPNHPALIHPDRCMTYAELADTADAMAGRLAALGVCAGDRVVVLLPRSIDLIVCLLGIIRLGAAYVPIDTAYPASRIERILRDSDAALMVYANTLQSSVETCPGRKTTIEGLHAAPRSEYTAPPEDPERPAYLMYTSGSTGMPKGVVVPQRAIQRLSNGDFMSHGRETVMLQLASVAFDASTLEIWGALLNGGTLAIYPDIDLDLKELTAFLNAYAVDSMWLTAALFEQWTTQLDSSLPNLRQVLAGGDVVSPHAVRRLQDRLPDVRVINGYGPTENTTFTCCHTIAKDWPVDRAVPIGCPIAGTHVRVTDAHGQSLPVGGIGELLVGGLGLSLGYWRNPELTAEAFINDAQSNERFYRTGDLVRWRADGTLQYIGRSDDQVKIRGYRVELEEIKRCLLCFAGIAEVCVVVRDEGERILIAYFTAENQHDADLPAFREALRRHAADVLPRYMVPAAFVHLHALPVTANGKIDRRALPAPQAWNFTDVDFTAPETPLETRLAEIWLDLLRLDRVGVLDDFFALGGNSLLAIRMASAFEAQTGIVIPIREVFQRSTIRALAEWISSLSAADGAVADVGFSTETSATVIPTVARDSAIPASYAQQRLWFIDRIEGQSSQYNMPALFELRGELDLKAMQAAVDALVQRHEIMRTRYREVDGIATQVIESEAGVMVEFQDLVTLLGHERDERASALIDVATRAPFDLAEGPVFRVVVLRLTEDEYRLLFNMHHIASDGWSVGILIRDLAALYRAAHEGVAASLPTLPVQYADYAAWQREYLSPQRREAMQSYWSRQLGDLPQLHSLPLDKPRPARMTTRGAVLRSRVMPSLARSLNALARANDVSLFMLLQSTYALLLSRISAERDVVVGTPVAGRERQAFESLVGCFVNTVVIRNVIPERGSFTQYLAEAREMTLNAYEHQQLPFDMLVELINPARSASHLPLFQLWFVLQNMEVGTLTLPGLSIDEVSRDEVSAKFDLMLSATERGDGIDFNWVYNSDLFEASTILAWAESFEILLAGIVNAPQTDIGLLPLVGPVQQRALDRFASSIDVPFDSGTILHRFRESANAQPNQIAIRYGDMTLTYAELAARADRLAGYLVDLGVRPGESVCVCCGRSIEQLIAVLGIWQAGAAFVPMDPSTPQERLAFIVEDTAANWVLVTKVAADRFDLSKIDLLILDSAADDGNWLTEYADQADLSRADGLAYVIYTSGTTGQPKGVMINHGSLSNLGNGLDLVLRENGIDAPLRWAWNAPLMFDAALQAVTQLAVGSELHVLSENIRTSPKRLINYLHKHAIDVLDCTPSLLDILMQEAQFQGVALPNLVIGGEAINAAQWEDIAQAMARCGRVAMNVYGPTETTVDATWARIEPGTVPTIGKPLPNVRVRVLDERLQLLPPGAIGECCIGGAGVARGYLNRDTLTAEKFVDLCFSGEKQRYYRSGDVVRWSSDGRLMYLHRRDTQIKLRGYRIELGEIEHVLLSYPGIVEAAVRLSAKTDSLVAYLVSTGTAPEMEAVIEHCRRSLPEYMLPTACVLLQTLPLTRNGKLDVAALPEPCLFGGATENPRPSSPTEQALATVWSRILSRSELPVNGNFFALGGHSLLAIRVISAIRESFGVELPLAGFFEQPTIAQVAALIDRSERKRALPRITRVDNRESLPLSFSQHRLWLIDRLEGGSPQYNMPAAFELCGVFDEEACRRSLDLIVQRHEVLRTTYAEIDGRPVQRVHAEVSMPLPVSDLSGIAQESREEAVERAIRSDARRPFALDRDLMLRAQLLKLSPDNYVLIFNMHHIASDGWSVSVLIREFVTAYRAFSAGENPVMKPLPVQYGDFAYWQRRALANEVLAPEVDYWRRHLAALPHVHSLPLDKPRPIRQTYNGAVIQRRLDPKSLAALKRLIGSHDVTLFMILLSALSALIARWSNEHDIVIGTPVAGRYDESVEALIGFFLNTLILRSDLSGNPCFDEILRRTRENVLAAFSHQQVPFDMLVEALNPERSISHPTLFQIMFVLQNQEQTAFELPTLRMSPVERSMVVAKFDLLLNANETDAGLDLSWNYNTDLFEADTIARMADGYEQILHWIAVDMSTRLQALNLLPDSEANKILREWNDTAVALPYEQCLHALFVDQVRACPDALAVVDNQGDLSYGELFAQAAALAERLRPYAITSESLMGVLLPRGRSQVIATLGILMAGGAYLPLETAWPANRIDQVLAQGNASLLVSHEALVGELDQRVPVIDLSTIVPLPAKRAAEVLAEFVPVQTPDQLAYVIFTSGSTGKPKGVAIEHRSATNTILDINQRYGVGSSDAVLAVSALSFDLSVYDIFGLLAAGGCIVCPDDERQKDPAHWADLVERYRVSIWDSVPASAELLTAQYEWRERCGSGALRVVMMSGDWIPPSLPARIFAVFPDVEVHSLGGATEGSIWSISYPIVEDTSGRKSVPYGKPLANQRFYVLTDDLATCPVGVAGELHIGGIGVAREYYGDAERTAASYVQHDLLGDRLYKTGDIGRYMPDGNIEFIGRKDSQIKLRGFRIELGEIEAVLARSPYVAEAVVTVQRDSTQVQQLVAYITLEKASRGLLKDWPAELRAHLSTILPNYMVPSHCVVLDAMPLSANNKVDRKRLPEPVWDEHGSVHIDPDGPIEELLTSVWKEVLGRERVSVERNFFEIGGSSVHMIAIAGKTNLKLGAEIGVVSYFEHPTIRAMAKYIASKTSPDRPSNNHEKRSKSRLSQRLAKRDA